MKTSEKSKTTNRGRGHKDCTAAARRAAHLKLLKQQEAMIGKGAKRRREKYIVFSLDPHARQSMQDVVMACSPAAAVQRLRYKRLYACVESAVLLRDYITTLSLLLDGSDDDVEADFERLA
jgi:hypothetical protein